MILDFVVIDFETANKNYNSACSIGLAAVKDNIIVDEKYFLIHPPVLDFDTENIRIHGITSQEVKGAPKFNDVWEKISCFFDDNLIIAHNAIFDMSVLKSCLVEYDLVIPEFDYACSIPISTISCKTSRIGQSLKDRAAYFGIPLDNHHNALADAVACANLVIECIKASGRKSFQSFYRLNNDLPIKSFTELKPPKYFKKNNRKKFDKISISEIAASKDILDPAHTLFDKNIVFTGELTSMDRRQAMQRVVDLGAVLKSAVSSKTDYLIVGKQDISIVGDDGMSTKEEKAYFLKSKGHHIQILNEDEFIKLINK